MNTTTIEQPPAQQLSEQQETWLTARAAAQLCNKSHVWVHEQRKRKKFTWREQSGKGGKEWQVLLSSLPTDAQLAYYAQHTTAAPIETEQDSRERELQLYNEAPEYNRRKCDKYRQLLAATEHLRGKALRDYIQRWNATNPDDTTSYRSLMRTKQEYAENGIAALLGNYGKTRNRALALEGLGEFGERCYEYYKNLYLTQSQITIASAYIQTRGYALELYAKLNEGDITEFDTVFPSAATFQRSLESRVPEPTIYLARNGQEAYNNKYGNYLSRDYSAMQCGETWVSDHHQLDMMCIAPDGRMLRPWFTAWICMKSHKLLSWCLDVNPPNSDRIINTFADGVEEFGIPKRILIDNGKDYRAYDFSGSRRTFKIGIEDARARSITGQLGVEVRFAKPYNAKTKPIERMFRFFTEWLAKRTPGYVGRNTQERPAEQLEQQIAHRQLMQFSEIDTLLSFFVEGIFNKRPSEGKNHRGMSPDALFATEYRGLPTVRSEALALLRTRVSGTRTIGRNGIKDAETKDSYWGEWMEPAKGKKVYLRRSPKRWQEAYIFCAETDEYLGSATLGAWSTPAFADNDLEHSTVRQALRIQQQTARAAEAALQRTQMPTVQEQLRHLQLGLGITEGSATTPQRQNERSNVVRFTAMDEAVNAEQVFRATGTSDLAAFVPAEEERQPRRYRLWEDEATSEGQD